MLKLTLIFLIIILSSMAMAMDCKENLEYQRNLTTHENEIRDLKIKLKEQLIDICPRSKLATKFCKKKLKSFQKIIESRDTKFLRLEVNKICATKNKDIVKETRQLYDEPDKDGFFIAGAYRDGGNCINSQQANQACRDINQSLKGCKLDGNYLAVKCKKRSKKNSSTNICYEASPILSLLTSPYSVCQVSVKDLEKFAPCLAQSAKDNRRRLCPNGCARMPKTKICNWTDDEVNNYLGCLQIATKKQYKKLCPDRLEIKTPVSAKFPSKIKGCPNTRYPGKVKPWKLKFDSPWPGNTPKDKLLKVSAKPREFLALGFKVHAKNFKKEIAEGSEFAEEDESIIQKPRGSGTFFLKKAPGYTGIRDYSISKCPGLFSEDNIKQKCLLTTKKSGKIYWEVGIDSNDSCKLEADELYFLNIRFNRGCNWKKSCVVKIGNKRN